MDATAIDPIAAKQAIVDYCKKKGALAVGVADLAAIERIAPPGHRPTDLMPRVKSVISLGVGGQTAGAWSLPAKALAYFGSTETRAYGVAYGAAFFIEHKFGVRSIYCPPDMDPDGGPRVPLQSSFGGNQLRTNAEVKVAMALDGVDRAVTLFGIVGVVEQRVHGLVAFQVEDAENLAFANFLHPGFTRRADFADHGGLRVELAFNQHGDPQSAK